MKILICTQTVDSEDPALGFFVLWIEEFVAHGDQLTVVCLRVGPHQLPERVRIIPLGHRRLARAARLLWQSIRRRNEYDSVFVHMNPEYLVVAGWLWRLLGKRVVLWYTHKSVDARLRLGVLFAHQVLTASRASFRLSSDKVKVVGHGIDTTLYGASRASRDDLSIVTVGRITPTKRLHDMLSALEVLYARGIPFTFAIVGAPVMKGDHLYAAKLDEGIATLPFASSIRRYGAVAPRDVPLILQEYRVFLNLSGTGSFDKAVLEAVLAGLTPVTSNEAFKTLIEPLGMFVLSNEPSAIADALVRAKVVDMTPLRTLIKEEHSLNGLIPRIREALAGVGGAST